MDLEQAPCQESMTTGWWPWNKACPKVISSIDRLARAIDGSGIR